MWIRAMMLSAALAVASSSAEAGQRLEIGLKAFPKGTACTVSGTSGKVRAGGLGRTLRFVVRGDTRFVLLECILPDGRRFYVDTSRYVRHAARKTELRLSADNTGEVRWSGRNSQAIAGFLRFP